MRTTEESTKGQDQVGQATMPGDLNVIDEIARVLEGLSKSERQILEAELVVLARAKGCQGQAADHKKLMEFFG